ncbi:MAG: SusC/RagA family TonB-linked outer membrane protein [Bacteroidales bacterium]|nr:SusC/RagA family TonB-linked outer membrane protein [Bacteroidales bacterium]
MKHNYILIFILTLAAMLLCLTTKAASETSDSTAAAINVEYLRKAPSLVLSNTFQGLLPGVYVRCGSGGLGNNVSSFFVHGQHGQGAGEAIFIVDGIERAIDDFCIEEIESIEILKDIDAKLLYGPRAANGAILINTRRGVANSHSIRVSAEYGIAPVRRMPEFLGSYEYATLYNQARINDGLAPVYSDVQLNGYKNSTGESDLVYPNVDWYGKFIGDSQNYRKVSTEFIGGGHQMKYAVIATYTGGSGLEKVGPRPNQDRLNIRGNLDIRISDILTARADVAARLENKSWGQMNQASVFEAISTLRPNEYPLTIPETLVGVAPSSNGIPIMGGDMQSKSSFYDKLAYGGNAAERYILSQTNMGLDFNLSSLVPGLSADAYVTFDNYNYTSRNLSKYHPTYTVNPYLDESGGQLYQFTLVRQLTEGGDIKLGSETTRRTIGAKGGFKYSYKTGKHSLDAAATVRYFYEKGMKKNQDCVNTVASLNADYSYNDKLFARIVLADLGSNRIPTANHLFAPAVKLSYLLTPSVKLSASAGRMGYDPRDQYLKTSTTWKYSGDHMFGHLGEVKNYMADITNYGNPDLGWEIMDEADFGADMAFLDGRLIAGTGLFVEKRSGAMALPKSVSSLLGDFVKYENLNSCLNTGIDLNLVWNDKALGGNLSYTAGLNMVFSKNRVLTASESAGVTKDNTIIGRPTSSIFGLKSEGLFGRDIPLAGHAKQAFGRCVDGDLAYEDVTGDGVVDGRDEVFLGQTFPVLGMGAYLSLSYKRFSLFAKFTSELGAVSMRNNAYYWNTGHTSYSVLARDAYSPANPQGSLPRLTTETDGNSYRNSDFWLTSRDFLRLKNVELSYTFDGIKAIRSNSLKVFIQGSDLFVISPVKDLDPEMLNAGITNYPLCSIFAAGVTLTF